MNLVLLLFMAANARSEMLVETDWLAAHLQDPNVRIVDLRIRGYAEGHIPGASLLDNGATRDPKNPPTFLPKQEDFQQAMGKIGISNSSRVVVYDDRGGIYAVRLWWMLNHYGHANVALLNGGWVKWTKENRAVSTDVPQPAAVLFKTYVLKQGYRDGIPGFLVSAFGAMHIFLKYAKLWESRLDPPAPRRA